MLYATLAQVRAEMDEQAASSGEPSEAINDAYVLDALRTVTGRFRARLRPRDFLPLKTTIYIDALGHHIDDQQGLLGLATAFGIYPLLAVTDVVDGEGVTLELNEDYRPYPRASTPAFHLQLLTGGSWSKYSQTWLEAISVTGTFGYHSDYANAWLLSGDTVQDAPLSSSATAIHVANVSGENAYGISPRFSAGNLIQIENEWIEVVATDTNGNTLTVVRGARGTTAASHAQNTPIRVFQVEPAVNRIAWRYAAFLYARRGAFNRSTFDGVTTTEFPDDMPGEIENVLALFSDKNWSTP